LKSSIGVSVWILTAAAPWSLGCVSGDLPQRPMLTDASAGTGGSGGSAGVGGHGGSAGAGNGNVDGGPCSPADLQQDSTNCGTCGYACVHGRSCVAGACTPAWQPLTTDGVPTPRANHVGVILEGKYVVFGGASPAYGPAMASGAQYDLAGDTWAPIANLNAARVSHVGVSTGTSILTFGGLTAQSSGANEGPGLEEFTPDSTGGQWTALTPANTPPLRYNFSGIWTGSQFFIVGGGSNSAPNLSDAAVYTPGGGWMDYPSALSQAGWTIPVLFMQGSAVNVAWGGYPSYESGAGASFSAGQWSNWTEPADPNAYASPSYAVNGAHLLFVTSDQAPGYYTSASSLLGVAVLDTSKGTWTTDTAPFPTGFCISSNHVVAWSGSELVVWGGQCSPSDPNTVGTATVGGRYQPAAP
jgi:hypothetical protein